MDPRIIQLTHMGVTIFLIVKLITTINKFKSQEEDIEALETSVNELENDVIKLENKTTP